MPSRIWSREDLRNILLALYAAKFSQLAEPGAASEPEDAAALSYRWGYRVAIQSLMLACGLPLQLLDHALQQPGSFPQEQTASTQQWWIEDLENVIAAVYRSAISAPVRDPHMPDIEGYRQGFGEAIGAALQALGSQESLERWLADVHADRYWIFIAEQGTTEETTPPKIIGSNSSDTELLDPTAED